MKSSRLLLLLCVPLLCTLTSCGSTRGSVANAVRNYQGPALKFSLGWNGAELGLTLYGRPPAALSLEEAGRRFAALTSHAGSSGKTPIPPAPLP